MKITRLSALLVAAFIAALPLASQAFTAADAVQQISKLAQREWPTQQQAPASIPQGAKTETGFSPDGNALHLVLKVIGSAEESLDVMAYSFTSADVTRALLAATKRGVRVRLLVDHDHNLVKDRSGKPRSALSALTTAGAHVRSVSDYAIFHDKTIVADKRHLQTGSFNYSQAAATRNSENVLVLWNAPETAAQYQGHFENRWRRGRDFVGR